MTATMLAKRLILPVGEPAALCARLGLLIPPGFEAEPAPVRTPGLLVDGDIDAAVAAGLAATCSPHVGVLIRSTVGEVVAALGVRAELGGSMVRAGGSAVELAAWPAVRLREEMTRVIPPLGHSTLPALHLPIEQLPEQPGLRDRVIGTMRVTVVAPPHVVGQVVWLATGEGWLALAPAEVRDGVRWVTLRPVQRDEIGASVASLVAAGLS